MVVGLYQMRQIENEIIERCKRGDREAFRTVVLRYQRMLFSLSLKMLCNEDEAKDVVQDTFLRAWMNIETYNSNHGFSTWLYTIASRLCIDRLRSVGHSMPMPDDEALFREYYDGDSGERQLENSEWVAIVRLLAGRLGAKQRLVFTLVQLEGLDTEEVMAITGLDARQIKSNLYAARQTIREQLKQLGYGQD